MARLAFALAIITTALSLCNIAAQDMDKAIEIGTKAARGVCWYEYLKVMPDKKQKSNKFGNCYKNLNLKRAMDQFAALGIKRSNYMAIKGSLGPSFIGFVKMFAPPQYSACNEYMLDPEKTYSKDYSAILKDGSDSYPYKGWAHCLLDKMEETHGQQAVDAMKEKWSSESHPWINEALNRENENRRRHGAPALELNKELSDRAQQWADGLGKKCAPLARSDHISKSNPDAIYNGTQCGENIAMRGSAAEELIVPAEDDALFAADAWYEEIRDYPWPEYKGKGTDAVFFKIGHFTASVWKGSQQVGYGLSKRDGCYRTYIVARYWPGGNVVGKFGENVAPPT